MNGNEEILPKRSRCESSLKKEADRDITERQFKVLPETEQELSKILHSYNYLSHSFDCLSSVDCSAD